MKNNRIFVHMAIVLCCMAGVILLYHFSSKEKLKDRVSVESVKSTGKIKKKNNEKQAGRGVYRIYLDADMTNARNSGLSIEKGIRVALAEHGNRIGTRSVELVVRDHHGNVKRSRRHLEEFCNDPSALAVFCGLHSPPVLSNLSFIQQNEILLLDSWAAAGPITRKTDDKGSNWVFRLSVDDTKAGYVLVRHAIEQEGFKRPALLLENTGWGKSNEKTLRAALAKRGLVPQATVFFDWNIGRTGAEQILNDLYEAKVDVIFFVANAPEGKTFMLAMTERVRRERLPIRSHWGITGGDFYDVLGGKLLTRDIDLMFLQTSFSFRLSVQSELAQKVFLALKTLAPEIRNADDLRAPTGFVHAFDLTRLFLAAAKKSAYREDIRAFRQNIRAALEELTDPVEGLVKTYKKPFSKFSPDKPDAHEALGRENLRMARYVETGGIELIGARKESGRRSHANSIE